jgi:hypothetical protein
MRCLRFFRQATAQRFNLVAKSFVLGRDLFSFCFSLGRGFL